MRELKTGTEINVGNVFEFAFNKSGKYLALLIDAADQAGNGLQIRDMSSGTITSLEADKAFYERMAWTQEGDALSMLKGTDDRTYREQMKFQLAEGQTLQLRAKVGCRPVIWLSDSNAWATVSGAPGSRFVLDGILVAGLPFNVEGDLAEVTIRHSTLVPGSAGRTR